MTESVPFNYFALRSAIIYSGVMYSFTLSLPSQQIVFGQFYFTSLKQTLIVSYLESYLNDLKRRLSEWRIAINVSKNAAIIFARAGRRFIQPRPVTLSGELI